MGDDLIRAITALVSSLPYGTYSIDNRQAIYNDWLKKNSALLDKAQKGIDSTIEESNRQPGDFDKPSSIFNR